MSDRLKREAILDSELYSSLKIIFDLAYQMCGYVGHRTTDHTGRLVIKPHLKDALDRVERLLDDTQKNLDRRAKTKVYFIQSENEGPIKIGCAIDPIARMLSLQTSHPNQLRLLAVVDGSYKEEAKLHRLFANYRIKGEWFHPSTQLTEYIALISEQEQNV